ncbi:MAG: ABC transporter permease, partial [Bdellovibrionaceae bacterium]|nr:ABC transporter permease [Pseudobdellovibrionaceae bacterium]
MVIFSFLSRGVYGELIWDFSLEAWGRAFEPVQMQVILNSVWLAMFTAAATVALGILMAWCVATAPARWRSFLITLMTIPFLTNLIIRVFALKSFLGVEGPVQYLLTILAIPFDPFALSANSILVYVGMVLTYLPFATLPLYSALERFDFSLIEAAQDLGAGQGRVFFTVLIPALRGAFGVAALLVFVPALGEYVVPDLLGGAKSIYFGNFITEQFLKMRNWPLGASSAVVMMGLML